MFRNIIYVFSIINLFFYCCFGETNTKKKCSSCKSGKKKSNENVNNKISKKDNKKRSCCNRYCVKKALDKSANNDEDADKEREERERLEREEKEKKEKERQRLEYLEKNKKKFNEYKKECTNSLNAVVNKNGFLPDDGEPKYRLDIEKSRLENDIKNIDSEEKYKKVKGELDDISNKLDTSFTNLKLAYLNRLSKLINDDDVYKKSVDNTSTFEINLKVEDINSLNFDESISNISNKLKKLENEHYTRFNAYYEKLKTKFNELVEKSKDIKDGDKKKAVDKLLNDKDKKFNNVDNSTKLALLKDYINDLENVITKDLTDLVVLLEEKFQKYKNIINEFELQKDIVKDSILAEIKDCKSYENITNLQKELENIFKEIQKQIDSKNETIKQQRGVLNKQILNFGANKRSLTIDKTLSSDTINLVDPQISVYNDININITDVTKCLNNEIENLKTKYNETIVNINNCIKSDNFNGIPALNNDIPNALNSSSLNGESNPIVDIEKQINEKLKAIHDKLDSIYNDIIAKYDIFKNNIVGEDFSYEEINDLNACFEKIEVDGNNFYIDINYNNPSSTNFESTINTIKKLKEDFSTKIADLKNKYEENIKNFKIIYILEENAQKNNLDKLKIDTDNDILKQTFNELEQYIKGNSNSLYINFSKKIENLNNIIKVYNKNKIDENVLESVTIDLTQYFKINDSSEVICVTKSLVELSNTIKNEETRINGVFETLKSNVNAKYEDLKKSYGIELNTEDLGKLSTKEDISNFTKCIEEIHKLYSEEGNYLYNYFNTRIKNIKEKVKALNKNCFKIKFDDKEFEIGDYFDNTGTYSIKKEKDLKELKSAIDVYELYIKNSIAYLKNAYRNKYEVLIDKFGEELSTDDNNFKEIDLNTKPETLSQKIEILNEPITKYNSQEFNDIIKAFEKLRDDNLDIKNKKLLGITENPKFEFKKIENNNISTLININAALESIYETYTNIAKVINDAVNFIVKEKDKDLNIKIFTENFPQIFPEPFNDGNSIMSEIRIEIKKCTNYKNFDHENINIKRDLINDLNSKINKKSELLFKLLKLLISEMKKFAAFGGIKDLNINYKDRKATDIAQNIDQTYKDVFTENFISKMQENFKKLANDNMAKINEYNKKLGLKLKDIEGEIKYIFSIGDKTTFLDILSKLYSSTIKLSVTSDSCIRKVVKLKQFRDYFTKNNSKIFTGDEIGEIEKINDKVIDDDGIEQEISTSWRNFYNIKCFQDYYNNNIGKYKQFLKKYATAIGEFFEAMKIIKDFQIDDNLEYSYNDDVNMEIIEHIKWYNCVPSVILDYILCKSDMLYKSPYIGNFSICFKEITDFYFGENYKNYKNDYKILKSIYDLFKNKGIEDFQTKCDNFPSDTNCEKEVEELTKKYTDDILTDSDTKKKISNMVEYVEKCKETVKKLKKKIKNFILDKRKDIKGQCSRYYEINYSRILDKEVNLENLNNEGNIYEIKKYCEILAEYCIHINTVIDIKKFVWEEMNKKTPDAAKKNKFINNIISISDTSMFRDLYKHGLLDDDTFFNIPGDSNVLNNLSTVITNNLNGHVSEEVYNDLQNLCNRYLINSEGSYIIYDDDKRTHIVEHYDFVNGNNIYNCKYIDFSNGEKKVQHGYCYKKWKEGRNCGHNHFLLKEEDEIEFNNNTVELYLFNNNSRENVKISGGGKLEILDLSEFKSGHIRDLKGFINKNKGKLKTIIFNENFEINDFKELFKDCSKLETIEGFENVKVPYNINVYDVTSMFEGCTALKNICLPKELKKLSKVTNVFKDVSVPFLDLTSIDDLTDDQIKDIFSIKDGNYFVSGSNLPCDNSHIGYRKIRVKNENLINKIVNYFEKKIDEDIRKYLHVYTYDDIDDNKIIVVNSEIPNDQY